MRPLVLAALGVATLFAAVAPAMADARIPLKDGAYSQSASQCAAMRRGDSDGAPYSVEKGGRMISGPEQACVVATVRRVRPNRYHVQTDCREFDEVYHLSFFLDALSPQRFRRDGEEFRWCLELDADGVMILEQEETSSPSRTSVEKPSDKALIDYWAEQNEACRGGPGNVPETDRACERRQAASDELARRQLCYKPYKGMMDWVRCR